MAALPDSEGGSVALLDQGSWVAVVWRKAGIAAAAAASGDERSSHRRCCRSVRCRWHSSHSLPPWLLPSGSRHALVMQQLNMLDYFSVAGGTWWPPGQCHPPLDSRPPVRGPVSRFAVITTLVRAIRAWVR